MRAYFLLLPFVVVSLYTKAQVCEFDSNARSPHPAIFTTVSVSSLKKYIEALEYFSSPDSSNHLLLKIEFSDVRRRVAFEGDTAIIILKNKQQIKLTNLRKFFARTTQIRAIVEIDMYAVSFVSWIKKTDVAELSKSSVKRITFYVGLEDAVELHQKTINRRHQRYLKIGVIGFTRKYIRDLSTCALSLP